MVEALNKLGSRRPTKQRFSLVYTSSEGKLTLRAKTAEFVPTSLQQVADSLVLDSGLSEREPFADNTIEVLNL